MMIDMAEVEVLITGYVREAHDGEHVQPTVSLVRAGDAVAIVDPGILRDVGELDDQLQRRGLGRGDITHVLLTHHHIDHTRNVGLFTAATVVDRDSTYQGDVWGEGPGDGGDVLPGVTAIATPGHTLECASYLARTAEGVVVFTHAWWFSDRTPEVDPLAEDQQQLVASRRRILDVADLVVPGHGAPFRVTH